MKKVTLVHLGCAKNLVDSEVMLGVLKKAGYAFVEKPRAADYIIVNTCGFIQPARDEAEQTLEDVLLLKRKHPGIKVVVTGCYVERDEIRLRRKYPDVDAWTGVRSFDKIAELLEGRPAPSPGRTYLYSDDSPRLVSTPGTWAYVKISEGCSHNCGFCAIPMIKGPYRSRSMASVIREVQSLAGLGVKEVNLVSHDTTFYGRDRGVRDGLVKLIEHLTKVDGLEWIRMLYGYPEEVTDSLLEIMTEPKVCAYLDIPFQHADPAIIRAMRRGMDDGKAFRLLDKIRTRVPGVAVRTSLIVGFPGEGRREFERLERFVEKARFNHLGVFTYSAEQDTSSFGLRDSVPPQEKEQRRSQLMAIQADVSFAKNRAYIGSVREILVEGRAKPGSQGLVGRTRFQAPEVDGLVRVTVPRRASARGVPLVKAEIISAEPYDLVARLVL